MRIFGRQVKASEIFLFIFIYLVVNYSVIKIQQKWQESHLNDPRWLREHVGDNANPIDFLQSEGNVDNKDGTYGGDLPDAQPLESPALKPGLAGIQDLEIATDEPPHGDDDETQWKFKDDAPPEEKPQEGTFGDGEDYGDYNDFNEDKHDTQKLKTILFWNTFFTATDFRFGFGHQAFLENKCPVHTCRTTNDRKQLLQADAVVFHGPRIEGFPPPERRPGQIYVYVQQEPHYIMSQEELPAYEGHFNITITHRSDSDIYIPYGRVIYNEENIRKPIHINLRSRPKSIIWAVSHCSTPSRRELYVKELQKYIDIDIFGACGDLECSKDDYLGCFSQFEKEYKYYMALENNYCKDYISEKVYRSLLYKMVPIVFGGGNYTQGTPPHSVIDINDYPNPKDLADYLNSLSHNDKAYNKYFEWKTTGYELEHQRKIIMGDAFCKLCEVLHAPNYNYKYKNYRDLKSWWVNGMCDPFIVQRWRKKHKW